MWRLRASLVGAFALLSGLCGPALAAEEAVTIVLNQARILRLPDKAKTIVVGNPMIADVTMQRNNNLVLTGKSFGATNLIALDDKGNIIAESRIRVEAPQEGMVIVQRGLNRESYSCAPLCQPTISPGDSKQFFEDLVTQSEKHLTLSAPK